MSTQEEDKKKQNLTTTKHNCYIIHRRIRCVIYLLRWPANFIDCVQVTHTYRIGLDGRSVIYLCQIEWHSYSKLIDWTCARTQHRRISARPKRSRWGTRVWVWLDMRICGLFVDRWAELWNRSKAQHNHTHSHTHEQRHLCGWDVCSVARFDKAASGPEKTHCIVDQELKCVWLL